MVVSIRSHRSRRFREYALSMLLLAACSSGSNIETLDIIRRRGEFDSYQILLNQPITVTAGTRSLPGHEVVFGMTRRNEVRESYFAVVALDDQYVKFTITQTLDPTGTAHELE